MENLKAIASQKATEILTGKIKVPSFTQKPEKHSSEPEIDDDAIAQEAAASKMLHAFESKNPKKFTEALKECLEILGVSYRGQSEDKEV